VPELPILRWREEIISAVRDHQVVIVAGETGSGKSTQLPQMCLEAGRATEGMIGHTQPRRIAARAVAERVAEELGTEVGGLVGYAVRFTDRVGRNTRIKVMTDGILLNEVHRDRDLSRYDTIIIDEAHERSLNIDFLLGYLHRLIPRRPDLRVLITSATIDTARVAAHFDNAPVISVAGRSYPVEVRYHPIEDDETDEVQAVCDAVAELTKEGAGDILVFLSGEREIRDTADALDRSSRPDLGLLDVLPLYGRLSAAEQHRVFERHEARRVVLATNVAETSLTVPGIRVVVDPGTARISRYSTRTKVQRLPIEPVSQASANQRAGRCGRVAPGICVRLYSEEDFVGRPQFTEPEILRTNLASVVLQMAALRLGDVADFPFVDPPDRRAVRDAVALLQELGAFSSSGREPRITSLGRRLARLPVDPRLGRMLLAAEPLGCAADVAVIVAALSIQDPRERPAARAAAWQEKHGRFATGTSDFLSYLALWDYLQDEQNTRSSSGFRRLCRTDFLNYLRVREWQDLVAQLGRIVDLPEPEHRAERQDIHLALLAGLLSQIGMRDRETREYQGARGTRFAIGAGSVAADKPPRWVMAAELVETGRLWARTVAPIRPEWAERLAGDLAKRTYGEPWWDARRGQAMTSERITLYGLPIVAGRSVPYARIDTAGARSLFVHHALVEGECRCELPFREHNQRALDDVHALEQRARRDLAITEQELFDLYDSRIPNEIATVSQFERWSLAQPPGLLEFGLDELIAGGAKVDPDGYPDTWEQGAITLPVTYRFDPSTDDDGVTVHVALTALNRLTPAGFDWLVPAWREELVTALIRTLPKAVRRNFVPAPDFARRFLGEARPWDGPLIDRLEAVLPPMTGDPIPKGSFRPEQLPPYLRATFAVHTADGEVVGQGRDLAALQHALAPLARAAIVAALPPIEQSGKRRWTFGTIPERLDSGDARGYPALVDEGQTVGLRVLTSPSEQRAAMWSGVRRLVRIMSGTGRRSVARDLSTASALALARAPRWPAAAVLDKCIDAAADELISRHGGPPWDEQSFDELLAHVSPRLHATAVRVATEAADIVALAGELSSRLATTNAPPLRPAVDDMARQLDALVPNDFPWVPGAARLPDVLRYLRGIERRLDKLAEAPARDAAAMRRVHALEVEHEHLLENLTGPEARAEARLLRWMLEELRVSLFAQSLRPAYRVSEERVRRAFSELATREAHR
jgi:ATP-dependent helicase HrpA